MVQIDPLADIRHYSPTMTISQVLKFCEKKDVQITRAMIQNYIRDGLLPPPVNKRQYTHKHLAAMIMITRLKSVFEIPAIRAALSPHLDAEGLPLEIYAELTASAEHFTRTFQSDGALHTMTCAAALKNLINKGDDIP